MFRSSPQSKVSLGAAVITAVVLGLTASALAVDRPENGRITFGRFDPKLNDYSIWASNPDGSAQQRLTNVPSFNSNWSPNGRRVAFDFVNAGGEHVATMDSDGHHVAQLTFGPTIQEVPKWSPDGQSITFDASAMSLDDPNFSTSIWVMRADGSHPSRLT